MAGENTYAFGNCTWYVARTLPWVRGGWGNAKDWATNAIRDSFSVVGFPLIGAVVVYGGGDGYSALGHVAIVEEVYPNGTFLVSEMNFVAFDQTDERVSTLGDVAGFIEPPAGAPPPPGVGGGGNDAGDVHVAETTAVWDHMRGYWNNGAFWQSIETDVITAAAAVLSSL